MKKRSILFCEGVRLYLMWTISVKVAPRLWDQEVIQANAGATRTVRDSKYSVDLITNIFVFPLIIILTASALVANLLKCVVNHRAE